MADLTKEGLYQDFISTAARLGAFGRDGAEYIADKLGSEVLDDATSEGLQWVGDIINGELD